jgi:hypothetical protein
VQNLAQTSLETDRVFGDGYAQQLAATTGSVASGYVAELSVGCSGGRRRRAPGVGTR